MHYTVDGQMVPTILSFFQSIVHPNIEPFYVGDASGGVAVMIDPRIAIIKELIEKKQWKEALEDIEKGIQIIFKNIDNNMNEMAKARTNIKNALEQLQRPIPSEGPEIRPEDPMSARDKEKMDNDKKELEESEANEKEKGKENMKNLKETQTTTINGYMEGYIRDYEMFLKHISSYNDIKSKVTSILAYVEELKANIARSTEHIRTLTQEIEQLNRIFSYLSGGFAADGGYIKYMAVKNKEIASARSSLSSIQASLPSIKFKLEFTRGNAANEQERMRFEQQIIDVASIEKTIGDMLLLLGDLSRLLTQVENRLDSSPGNLKVKQSMIELYQKDLEENQQKLAIFRPYIEDMTAMRQIFANSDAKIADLPAKRSEFIKAITATRMVVDSIPIS